MAKRGRPKGKNFTKMLTVRISDDEFAILKELASAHGTTMSNYIRWIIMKEYEKLNFERIN